MKANSIIFIIVTAITISSAVDGTPMAVLPTFLTEGNRIDHRTLQEQIANGTAKCYSTMEETNPNRYCILDDTPREGTFLLVSCPDSRGDNLYECSCSIGVGDPADAPNTPTCEQCFFCQDSTLSYNCQNVATGTCIGRSCGDECIASLDSAAMAPSIFWTPVVAIIISFVSY